MEFDWNAEGDMSGLGVLPGRVLRFAVARANIFAPQFHPKKSAGVGLRWYRNFVDWNR